MVSLKYFKTSNKRKKKDLFGYKQTAIYYLHLIYLFIVKNIKLVKSKKQFSFSDALATYVSSLWLTPKQFLFHVDLKTIFMEIGTTDNIIFRELEVTYVIPSTNVLKLYFCSLPLSFWIRECKI